MTRERSRKRRRQVLKGITSAGTVLVAGCIGDGGGGSTDSGGNGSNATTGDGGGGATSIKFVHISSFGGDAKDIVPMFNEQSDVTVNSTSTPAESTSTRKYFINKFISKSPSFDTGMMDVIWPAGFVNKGWISQVKDPNNLTEKMLDTPVEAATINNNLYGMPLFTDANAFYYRKDILDKYGFEPPKTYMEVVNQAQEVLKKEDGINNGYIWQGGSNEGLTIMWLNWLWGYGGTVHHNDKLKVNTDKGIKALEHAVSLIHQYNVSPQSVAAGKTDQNRQTFQQGNTLFMRNWPYAVALMNKEESPVKGKFSVTKMPKAEGHLDANNSCLGGWSVFINKFSNKKGAAQQFAQFIVTKEVQKNLALKHSRLPVRKDLYKPEIFEQAPLLETFADIVKQTSARPATPKYTTFSEIVYTQCNKALVKNMSPKQALNDAQSQIDDKVNNASG